jgi:hypothetical protein
VQSLFATQRILLDLAMRQNENILHALRQQLADPHRSPTTLLNEAAGEGMSNFIEGQKILLDLCKQQNEILMTGLKERAGDSPAAQAVTDVLPRSLKTLLHMQEEFLKIAATKSHAWMEAAQAGKPYESKHLVDLASEALENLVKAQKEVLDVIAEGTGKATGAKHHAGPVKKLKKTELTELARRAGESFIDAPKKLVDLAGKQMNATVKTAGRGLELLRPFPFLPLAEVAREGVKSYVDAQKAVVEAVVKPAARPLGQHKHPGKPAGHGKKPVARSKQEAA